MRCVTLGTSGEEFHWDLIRLACGSVADIAIMPMQDIWAWEASADERAGQGRRKLGLEVHVAEQLTPRDQGPAGGVDRGLRPMERPIRDLDPRHVPDPRVTRTPKESGQKGESSKSSLQ